jgi:UPF0716 protein FxsA
MSAIASAIGRGAARVGDAAAATYPGPVFIVLLLLIAVPVLEIAVFVQVASAIGVLDTLGILVLFSVGGLVLVRHEGLGTMARMRAELDAGRVPAGQLADGFWLCLAGLLLIIPGFVTDIAGLLLLLPPVRSLAKWGVARRFGQGSGTTVIRVEGTRVDGSWNESTWSTGAGHGGNWIEADGSERRDEPPELLP